MVREIEERHLAELKSQLKRIITRAKIGMCLSLTLIYICSFIGIAAFLRKNYIIAAADVISIAIWSYNFRNYWKIF